MRRLLIIPLALFVLLIGAMWWSGGAIEKRADFSFINRGDIYTLDINTMTYMQDFRLTYGIREGLFSPAPVTFRPVPTGAASHEVSSDNLTWTFHLRPNALWSNGDPVRSGDYAFSWRRMLEEPGEYTYLFFYIKNAENYQNSYAKGEPIDWKTVGIETPDDLTLIVKLNNPVTYLLELMAFPPFYPRHEPSMRPFRIFGESDLFDRLSQYIAAAKKPQASSSAEQFAKAVGRRPAPAAAEMRSFVSRARDFDLAAAPLPQVLEMLGLFEKLKPFDDGSELASKLHEMVQRQYIRYSFRADYTRPAAKQGEPGVVTNGPFVLTRWDYKRRLILEKSQNYWDRDSVRSNKMEVVVSDVPLNQFLIYESGEVDWVAEALGDIPAELKAKGRKDLRTTPAFGTMFLTLLCRPQLPASCGGGKNPLADIRVRQALAMATDKQFIVDNVTRMGELPARTYLPPDGTLPDFRWLPGPFDKTRTSDKPYDPAEVRALLTAPAAPPGPGLPYNVELARKLLADAGYPNGEGFPHLPVLFNTDSAVRSKIAEACKSEWKAALNIDVELQAIEGKIFKERVSKKDYAIGTIAWYGDYPDVSTFTDKYLSTSLQNDSDWQNKKFDDLCAKAAREGDAAARVKILSEAENLIDTEMPILPIYHYINISLNRDNVHGVEPNPRNLTVFKAVYVDR